MCHLWGRFCPTVKKDSVNSFNKTIAFRTFKNHCVLICQSRKRSSLLNFFSSLCFFFFCIKTSKAGKARKRKASRKRSIEFRAITKQNKLCVMKRRDVITLDCNFSSSSGLTLTIILKGRLSFPTIQHQLHCTT